MSNDNNDGNVVHLDMRPKDLAMEAFYEWMGERHIQSIHALVKICEVSIYDCGGPTHRIGDEVFLGGYQIDWDALAIDCMSEPYPIHLVYFTESKRECQTLAKKAAKDRILYAEGYFAVITNDDGSKNMTVYEPVFHNIPSEHKRQARELFKGMKGKSVP